MSHIIFRNAEHQDAPAIVSLIRESFDAQRLDTMVYGCERVDRYVQMQVDLDPRLADRLYSVAVDASGVVACVELAIRPEVLFLNYIAVSKKLRGTGLSARLLEHAISAAGRGNHRSMELDVFSDNRVAREWYQRLGFHEVASSSLLSMALLEPAATPGRVAGFAQAEACHREFGFSSLNIISSSRSVAVGRLGARWFRLPTTEGVEDGEILAALHVLDPNRRLLVAGEAGAYPSAGVIAHSLRMRCDLDRLRSALKARRPDARA